VDDHEIYHQRYSKHIEAKQQRAKLDSSPTLPYIPLSQDLGDSQHHHQDHTRPLLPATPPQYTSTLNRDDKQTNSLGSPSPLQKDSKGSYRHDKHSLSVNRSTVNTGGNEENKHLPRTQPCSQSPNTRQEVFSGLIPSVSAIDRTPSNEDQSPLETVAPSYAEAVSLATTPSSNATSTTTTTIAASGVNAAQKATSTSTSIDPLASPVSIYSQRSLKPSSSPKSSSEVVTSMPFVINNRSEDWDRGASHGSLSYLSHPVANLRHPWPDNLTLVSTI
jgi:hypothetical protein